MSRGNIRGRDVFEFGIRHARSPRGFTTETLQNVDTHAPCATGKNGQRSRGTPEGRHREGMPTFSRTQLEQIFLFRGFPVNIQYVVFSAHAVQRRTTPAVLMNPMFGLGGFKTKPR